MKTITVERNFRISNDDPYLKERLFLTREVPDEVDEDKIMNVLREKLIANFKAAYPNVRTYLNFDEVVQVNNDVDLSKMNWQGLKQEPALYPNGSKIIIPDEKINKGTIEAVKKEMRNYTLGAKIFKRVYGEMVKDNAELKKVFDEKLAELENKNTIKNE